MERVGMTQTGRALAYIKDALTEMALIGETHTNTAQIDIVKDQRYYSLPSECIKLLDIRVKDHNNDDGLIRSIPRSVYEPVIIDEADPILAVSVSSLSAPSGTNSHTFTISNSDSDAASYKALTWTISSDQSWLVPSPTSGESNDEIDTITVTYIKSGIVDSYTGNLSISSNGGSATIPVSMDIGVAVMNLSATGFTFLPAEDIKYLHINNTGDSSFSWTISDIGVNMSLDSTSGTVTDETDTVAITVDRSGLTIDVTQSITVNDGTTDTIIPIIIKV